MPRRELLKPAMQLGAIGAGGMAVQGCGSSKAAEPDQAAGGSGASAAAPSGNYRIDVRGARKA